MKETVTTKFTLQEKESDATEYDRFTVIFKIQDILPYTSSTLPQVKRNFLLFQRMVFVGLLGGNTE